MEIARLLVRLEADIGKFKSNMSEADRAIHDLGGRMQSVGRSMSLGLTVPLVGLGTVAVKAAADMDNLMRGLTSVAGSSGKAAEQFARLKEVAKLPGLGLEEAVRGSINLQAAGFSATQSESAIRAFGNALATVGKGREDLQGVILALGQIASKGKISAEEINQLAERVPQIRAAMQAAFGTSNTDQLQKMGISATAFVEGVTAQLNKLPAVTGGASNSFENLSDTLNQTAASFGQILLPVLLPVVDGISRFAGWLAQLTPQMQQTILVVGGTVAAMGPLLVSVGTIAKLLPVIRIGFAALTGPIGLTIAAVTALAAIWAIWGDDIKRIVTETYTAIKTWLLDRFSAVVEGVRKKVEAVTGFFRGMYDAVVGHSYVPDMIAGIGTEFGRLDALMVTPAAKAAAAVEGIMMRLAALQDARLAAQQKRLAEFAALGGKLTPVSVPGSEPGTEKKAPPPSIFDRAKKAADFAGQGKFGSAFQAASGLAPLAAAALALKPVFDGLRATLAPVLDALAAPLRAVGQLLGTVIAPVLSLLEKPLTMLAKAASYVVQAFGSLVSGLGKFLNAILPGSPFNFLVRYGDEMTSGARAAREALNGTADAANRASASISNMPAVFDLALRRRQASLGGVSAPTPPEGTAGSGGGGGVVININAGPGVDGRGLAQSLKTALRFDPELRFLVQQAAG